MDLNIRIPSNIEKLSFDPVFDPDVHLHFSEPDKIWTLKDFGYSEHQQLIAPYPVAVTSPFQILSEKGVEVLTNVISELCHYRRGSERMANYIRGALYHSQFLRGFCGNPEVNDFISKIAGASVRPHPMTLYQAHINLKPEDPSREVDRWHTDTVILDYVLMVTDPKSFQGGHFEYFQCTKSEAIRSLIKEDGHPDVVKVEFPEAGFAILQQGNKVVHRANRVDSGNERTTLVQSFIPTTAQFTDVSKLNDCKKVDPPEYLYSEWSRYKALMAKEKLENLVDTLPYTTDKNQLIMALRNAVRDIDEVILELSDSSEGYLTHFSDDPLTGLIPEA